MTRRFLLSAAALFLTMPAGCSPSGSGGGVKPLVVGMDITYPPFEFKNEKGEPDGVDVRMAEELAKFLGRPLRLEAIAFEGLIPALQSGQVDLVISALSINEIRKESIDFSDPYAFTGLAILTARNSPVRSIEDLKNRPVRVSAKLGTTGEIWARANLPQAEVIALDSEPACVLEVVQGRADAFLYDQLSIYRYHKENAATTKALLNPFVEEAWAVGVRKGNEELKSQVNAFLKTFRESGGLQRLGDQYLQDEKRLLEEMGIPFILR